MKAGVKTEVVEAELHRMRFENVCAKHPITGNSFQDACVPGTIDTIDEFAQPGEGMSMLLVDAAARGQGAMVCTMLRANANKNYQNPHGCTPLALRDRQTDTG